MSTAKIKEVVRDKYGQAAVRVQLGAAGNCSSDPGLESSCDPITSNLYNAAQEGEST
jgi:arsenite methyltransferase